MFLVRSRSPLDAEWEARDKRIVRAVGTKPDRSCAGTEGDGKYREHCWVVGSFGEARRVKLALESVPGVGPVLIREHITGTY